VADSSGLPLDAAGPWDVAEVDDPAEGRVDLGGLLVRPRDGVELRLQADQASGALVSIMLAAHDGAVELRPFASAKDVNQWDLAREEIAEQFRRQGSTVTEGSGEYGTELHIGQPVDVRGKKMIQPVRMAAVRGPRWVLRLTFYGTYATDPAPDSELIGALRDTVVVRGTGPIPPGEAIPLRLPPGVDLGNATVQPG
jgi:hypothetical protein